MREDAWLGERLGRPAYTMESGDTGLPAGPAFVQAKVSCSDVTRVGELEALGLRVVDVNVTLRRAAAPAPRPAGGVRDATDEDRDAVLAIAEHDYGVSRFHLDPAVPGDRACAIKRDWLDGFFSGSRGDRLLVAERDGEVVGFHLVLDGSQARTIDLIAVAQRARRTGAGTALVAALLDAEPARDVLVGTQVSNIEAMRLYERLGFGTVDAKYVLHGHIA